MNWKAIALSAALGACSTWSAAHAGSSVSDCDGALAKDIYTDATHYKVDWRLATLVTRDQWQQSHDGGGASAVIYGIPVGASYEDYKSNVDRFYASHNESLSIDYSRAIAIQEFTSTDLAGYEACLTALRSQKPGLYLSYDHLEDKSAVIVGYYNAGGNDPKSVRVVWSGDKVFTSPPPRKLVRGTAVTLAIARPSAQVANILVNGAANSGINGDSIVVPPFIPKPLPIWSLTVYPADDYIACAVNGQQIASRGINDPPITVVLSNVVPGDNVLTCHARDDHPDSNFNPCWSWGYALYRDGYLFLQDSDHRCGSGSPSQPTVPERHFTNAADSGKPVPNNAPLVSATDFLLALKRYMLLTKH